jgi:adenylate cyclase
MYASAPPVAIDLVEALAMLMAFLASADEVPGEALQTVARLTAGLDERFFAPPLPEPSQQVPTGPAGLDASSRLGEILVHLGIITPEQLDEALRIQRVWRQPLGMCTEKLGFATGAQIARALELQSRLRAATAPSAPLPQHTPLPGIRPAGHVTAHSHAPAPLPDHSLGSPAAPRRTEFKLELRERGRGSMLGEILLEQGHLSQEQLDHALRMQRAAGLRLGEALIQLGFSTREQVKQALLLQEKMRK